MFTSGSTGELVTLWCLLMKSDLLFRLFGYYSDIASTWLKCGSGHESAGEVVEVGEGVTQWKAGASSLIATLIRQSY